MEAAIHWKSESWGETLLKDWRGLFLLTQLPDRKARPSVQWSWTLCTLKVGSGTTAATFTFKWLSRVPTSWSRHYAISSGSLTPPPYPPPAPPSIILCLSLSFSPSHITQLSTEVQAYHPQSHQATLWGDSNKQRGLITHLWSGILSVKWLTKWRHWRLCWDWASRVLCPCVCQLRAFSIEAGSQRFRTLKYLKGLQN